MDLQSKMVPKAAAMKSSNLLVMWCQHGWFWGECVRIALSIRLALMTFPGGEQLTR